MPAQWIRTGASDEPRASADGVVEFLGVEDIAPHDREGFLDALLKFMPQPKNAVYPLRQATPHADARSSIADLWRGLIAHSRLLKGGAAYQGS